MDDPMEFLSDVWERREAWIDLPSKVNGHWIPYPAEWPDQMYLLARRIESCLRDEEDVYFSCAMYSDEGRRMEDALPTRWLWADLDNIPPRVCNELDLRPTVCWQSSPGRYQALWELDREIEVGVQSRVNRALTYAIGADKGGWDTTQVLRIPGTRNFKYPGGPGVREMWADGPVYNAGRLWKRLKKWDDQKREWKSRPRIELRDIGGRAKKLLRTPPEMVVQGERSARLWELECSLLERGLDEEKVFDLVWPSAWNKWYGMGSGERRLRADIAKAMKHVRAQVKVRREEHPASGAEEAEEKGLPFITGLDFIQKDIEPPSWLIKNIWMAESHGIIGGDPKSSKSLLTTAMALSVASGKPFLDRYECERTGPVLWIQEENQDSLMKDRIRRIAHSMGLLKKSGLPTRLGQAAIPRIHLMNNFGFDLGVEEHREKLEEAISDIQPRLLILDPLYLILGNINENYSSELRPYLKWFLAIRHEYNCAIAIVHHFRKPGEKYNGQVQSGHRLMGSGTLYGWVDSALYCQAVSVNDRKWNRRVHIEREFRSVGLRRSIDLKMRIGTPGGLTFECEAVDSTTGYRLEELVAKAGMIPAPQAAEELGCSTKTVRSWALDSQVLRYIPGRRGRGNAGKIEYLGQGANGSSA